jgi:hypothetical protein
MTTRRAGVSGSAAAEICGAGGSATGAGATGGAACGGGTAEGRTTTGVVGGAEATAAEGRATTAPARGGAATGAGRAAAAVAAETKVGRGPVCGITRLGAAASAGGSTAGAGLAAVERAAAGAPALAGGATVTAAAAGAGRGGADLAAASAFLRSRMSFSASPGLLTPERLIAFSVFAGAALGVAAERVPLVSRARTLTASSSSMELECVFFSVTPTAVRASRISLLLTSSSRARSLMRTLLIQSFFQARRSGPRLFPCAVS